MTFSGFTEGTLNFLKDLHANNNRDWFQANKARYEAHCVSPAMALIEALMPVAADLDPPHKAEPKLNGSFRRLNRDVRFSKDKSPYQARLHLVFWTGSHPNRSPGIHFVFAHDHFGFGAGQWGFDGDMLARYRHAVQDDRSRSALNDALAAAEAVGCSMGEPDLARTPRGFEATPETEVLLRYKGLVARTHNVKGHDPRLFGADAFPYLSDLMKRLVPIDHWLATHV